MSLIEEALRKQREETERGQTAPAAAPTPARETPPPLPAEAQQEAPAGTEPAAADVPPEKSRRTWRMLVGIGVLLVVVVAVLIWMMVFGVRLFRAPPPAAAPVAATRPASATATQAPAVLPAPVAVTAAVAVVAPPAPVVAAVPPPAPTAPTGAVAAVAAAAPTGAPPIASTGTVAGLPPELTKPPIVWPQITVSGIMGGGRDKRSMALVNGQMMNVGDMVESAKIVKIDRRGVTFSYSGETRTVSVGASTE